MEFERKVQKVQLDKTHPLSWYARSSLQRSRAFGSDGSIIGLRFAFCKVTLICLIVVLNFKDAVSRRGHSQRFPSVSFQFRFKCDPFERCISRNRLSSNVTTCQYKSQFCDSELMIVGVRDAFP